MAILLYPVEMLLRFEVKIRNPNDYVQAESQLVTNGSQGKGL